jgi:hypothetical protein
MVTYIPAAWKLQKRGGTSYVIQEKPRVEAGSNTSTVTLRVVGGDEKEVSNLRQ